MAANHYFIANDYLRAFDLKEIFAKYAVYYSNLHYPTEPLSGKDRHEITLKLEEAMNEMTILVLRMKDTKLVSDDLNGTIPKMPVQSGKVNEYRMAN